jgi:hypothetical protein
MASAFGTVSSNASGFVALDAFCDKLRSCATLDHDAAEEVAEALEAKTRSNIAEQRDPYGHLWRPSSDENPMLVNAMGAISIDAVGTKITFHVSGVEARHHVGSARGYHGGSAGLGGFRRSLIPFSKLPGPYKAIIREVLAKRFAQIFQEAA